MSKDMKVVLNFTKTGLGSISRLTSGTACSGPAVSVCGRGSPERRRCLSSGPLSVNQNVTQ